MPGKQIIVKVIATFAISLVFFQLAPLAANAAVFKGEENVVISEPVLDNLYVAGGNPVITADVQGDLFVAGGNVNVSGRVSGDLGAAGGTVNISGDVDGDVRVFGGTVIINSAIGGEVISFGGQVTYGPKARIAKDLIAGSDNLIIDPAAVVSGKKTIFTDPNKGKESPRQAENINAWLTAAFWASLFFIIAAYLLVAVVLMGAFPNVVKKYTQNVKIHGGMFWRPLGIGLLALFGFPLAALILLFTGIGALLSGILMLMWLLYMLISFVVAGFLLGAIAKQIITKQSSDLDWLWALGGVAALPLISSLPFVGWAIGLVFFVWAMGVLLTGDFQTFRSVK